MSGAEVTHMRDEDLLDEPIPSGRAPRAPRRRGRRAAAIAIAVVGLPLLTLALDAARASVSLETIVLLYLLIVVLVAWVGGVLVAMASAFAGASLINWFFVAPLHTFDVSQGEQLLALVTFLLVAGAVSGAVELADRRTRMAEQAAAEAETLAELARTDLREAETLGHVLERARRALDLEAVGLLAREAGRDAWETVERVGPSDAGSEEPLRFDVPAGPRLRLVGRGRPLFAEDQRVLRAFAAAAQTAYDGRRLSAEAREGRSLAVVDRQRTALLAAVGHDLRTPLAGIKAAVSTLRQTDVTWSDEQRDELLATIEESADRLDAVVANLLDASRLQAGELSVRARPVALDEVVGAALLALPHRGSDDIEVDVPDDMPLVLADAGLLERILVNLLTNAIQHAGHAGPIVVRAGKGAEVARLEVADHGPGVAPDRREEMFTPFRQLHDQRTVSGVGLGLAVARGFAEAMGGALVADAGPDGGLVMRLRLPLADAAASSP
jgi:two-component system, OmpR family, sensor histidine kinase KdpD